MSATQKVPLAEHQLDALVVEQRAVLDRADPRPDGLLDALGAVRVGGHERTARGSLLDRRPDERFGQLDVVDVGAAGQDRARGDDLDEVGAAIEDASHGGTHLRLVAHDADPRVRRAGGADRQARELAAALGCRDVRARRLHPWTDDPAGVDSVAQGAVEEGPKGADVADGGEACPEGCGRVAGTDEHLLRLAHGDRRHVGAFDVADEMRVAIDQARQDGERGEVDRRRALGEVGGRRQGRLDAVAADDDGSVAQELAALDVEDRSGANDGRLVGHRIQG